MPWYTNVAAMAGAAAPAPDIDTDATAWKSAVVTAGGTVSDTRLGLVSDLIGSLKTAGVWAKLDRLWLFAAENTQSATIDLAARISATPTGSPTFTADRGYTGSTSAYLDTGFNPSTATTPHYALDSAHISFWLRTSIADGTAVQMGSSTGTVTGATSISVSWNGSLFFAMNDPNTDAGRSAPVTRSGYWTVSRISSTTATAYQDGGSAVDNSIASAAVPNENILVNGLFNFGGAYTNGTTEQFSMASIGGGLTAQNVADFHTALSTYMTAVGA